MILIRNKLRLKLLTFDYFMHSGTSGSPHMQKHAVLLTANGANTKIKAKTDLIASSILLLNILLPPMGGRVEPFTI